MTGESETYKTGYQTIADINGISNDLVLSEVQVLTNLQTMLSNNEIKAPSIRFTETKDTGIPQVDLLKLSRDEQLKIKSGKAHFNEFD